MSPGRPFKRTEDVIEGAQRDRLSGEQPRGPCRLVLVHAEPCLGYGSTDADANPQSPDEILWSYGTGNGLIRASTGRNANLDTIAARKQNSNGDAARGLRLRATGEVRNLNSTCTQHRY